MEQVLLEIFGHMHWFSSPAKDSGRTNSTIPHFALGDSVVTEGWDQEEGLMQPPRSSAFWLHQKVFLETLH